MRAGLARLVVRLDGPSVQPASLILFDNVQADDYGLRMARTPLDLNLSSSDDTSEDLCTDHGHDACPDCGNVGVRIDSTGYVPCARFLTCWADVKDLS